MKNLTRRIWIGITLLLMVALAQETTERIITIRSEGGTQRSESLRYGPILYSHPDPEGVVATVSNLTIYAQNAQLAAPEGVLISQAQGERQAAFTDGVRVVRNRLEALGPALAYSEVTGLGVLEGRADVTVAPKEEGDDPVDITADEVTFDVDTDVSVSRGNVLLTSGNQSGETEELVFEEERNLAKMTSEGGQVTVQRIDEDGDELLITADVIRVLTGQDRLLATGNVTIIDGNITSSGDTVYFDDEASRAEVLGSPARSVNEAEGVEISGDRLEQRTDIDAVSIIDASVPSEFDEEAFVLTSEAQG